MLPCRLCESARVETLLRFDQQALSNRYLSGPKEKEALFTFVLGQCADCGMIQIPSPVSPAELKARFDWITYNEQEGHLDNLVERIIRLPGVKPNSAVGAISFKDDSTVARFRKAGFTRTWRIDIESDLGLGDRLAGLETLQSQLTAASAEHIAEKRGQADVLIVRHILEHAHEPRLFLDALRKLVTPDGYLVFEVPDCEPALKRGDFTMFWEEHILYFTSATLRQCLAKWGFALIHFERYIYSNENSLVAIARPTGGIKDGSPDKPLLAAMRETGTRYAESFPEYRQKMVGALENYRTHHGKIAVFGAGHLSCAWINFLGVSRHIEFIVDDHPKKKGLLMPGSRLPIRTSGELLEQSIKLCLLTLSPESEKKVIQKNQAFLDNAGVFASIFPCKNNSFAP